MPQDERQGIVLAAVREHVAAVLGHSSPDAVKVDQPFLELGLDSLGAVELRNRLADAAGMHLPGTAAFDHPTVADLAGYLLAGLEDQKRGKESGQGANPASSSGGTTLRDLFANANRQGEAQSIVPMLTEASRFHPAFHSIEELEAPPRPLQISTEGALPRLICVPSFVVGSGPHQFVKVARALEGRRPLTALSLPGAGRGESLPGSWDVAIDVLAESVREAAGGEPFVIVGYSIGGAIARSLVERLEGVGGSPAGLVMLDSPLPGSEHLAEMFAAVMEQLIEMDHDAVAIDDEHLLTMGAYLRLLGEWEQGPIGTPQLMVRAGKGPTATLGVQELTGWDGLEATTEIPGDHFAVIGDSAGATAEAIESWLAARAELESAGRP